MIKIALNNLTKIRTRERAVIKLVKKISKESPKIKDAEISVVFVGPGRIRTLNKKFFKHDRATDVIALELDTKTVFSEVFICLGVVRKNAQELGISFNEELKRVLIHGVLHAFGFEHKSYIVKNSKMLCLQERILTKVGSLRLV